MEDSHCESYHVLSPLMWSLVVDQLLDERLKPVTHCNTYIIGYYNPAARTIDIVSHTSNVCALILYKVGGTNSLTSTQNDRFFEKLFQCQLYLLKVFARNLLRENPGRNTLHILLWYLALESNPCLMSNKPTLYLLAYEDFIAHSNITNKYPAWYSTKRLTLLIIAPVVMSSYHL